MAKTKKTKKKTKRKLAHPNLPMQWQLNLLHEGTHFDLRPMFENLNKRYFRGRLRDYKVMWGRRRRQRPRNISSLAQFRNKIALFGSIGRWISHSCRLGFYGTCFITRCCTP